MVRVVFGGVCTQLNVNGVVEVAVSERSARWGGGARYGEGQSLGDGLGMSGEKSCGTLIQ